MRWLSKLSLSLHKCVLALIIVLVASGLAVIVFSLERYGNAAASAKAHVLALCWRVGWHWPVKLHLHAGEPTQHNRGVGVRALVYAGSDSAVHYLLPLFGSRDPFLAAEAISGLGEIDDPRGLVSLRSILLDDTLSTQPQGFAYRFLAIHAIRRKYIRTKSPDCLDALRQGIVARDARIGTRCAEVLASLTSTEPSSGPEHR